MKIVTNLNDISDILNQYNCDIAKIWLFDITHSKVALRLTSLKYEEVIYLVMLGCKYIKGNFSWESPEIFVNMFISNENSEHDYSIYDHKANFELTGDAGIVLAKGLESEFGNSFENFLTK